MVVGTCCQPCNLVKGTAFIRGGTGHLEYGQVTGYAPTACRLRRWRAAHIVRDYHRPARNPFTNKARLSFVEIEDIPRVVAVGEENAGATVTFKRDVVYVVSRW
jgi:hypothetical protein